MRISRWIPEATNTHLDYVILIALPQQQWLQKRASMLRYTYIDRLVYIVMNLLPRNRFCMWYVKFVG
jgi:hypothetical protein